MASCRVIDSWLRARFCGAFCRILPRLRAGSRERLAAEHHQKRTRTRFAHSSCLPFRAFRRAVAFVSRLQVVLKALDTQGRFRTLANQGRLVAGGSERSTIRGGWSRGVPNARHSRVVCLGSKLSYQCSTSGESGVGEGPNARHPGEVGLGNFPMLGIGGRSGWEGS